LKFSRDGDAGAPYSSIKLIKTGFGQTDPVADLLVLVVWISEPSRQRTRRRQQGYTISKCFMFTFSGEGN